MSNDLRAEPVCPAAATCRAIEIIEAESAYSQHLCAPAPEAKRLGLAAERVGSAAAILTRKSQNTMYNKLVGWGQASPGTAGQLDRFVQAARRHGVAKVSVPLGATARPRGLASLLQERGFRRGSPGAKLWRDGSPLPAPARAPALRGTDPGIRSRIRVRRVRPAEAPLWVDLVAEVWRVFGYRRPWFEARVSAPGWSHYLAWIEDRPVAAGALFVATIGRGRRAVTVGHLVDGVTLKPFRRQGAQSVVIRRRIADGRRLGCSFFTSETAPPLPRMPLVSFRNLRRQGFELAYLRHSWSLEI